MLISIEDKFWSKVDRVDDRNSCWLWMGSRYTHRYKRDIKTYGLWRTGNQRKGTKQDEAAHRASYRFTYGAIPNNLNVLHKCDNPQCVRPSHLFLGTQADNVKDMVNKGRCLRAQGSRHWKSKLTEKDVIYIRRQYHPGKGGNVDKLANKFSVHRATIVWVATKGWKHITSGLSIKYATI